MNSACLSSRIVETASISIIELFMNARCSTWKKSAPGLLIGMYMFDEHSMIAQARRIVDTEKFIADMDVSRDDSSIAIMINSICPFLSCMKFSTMRVSSIRGGVWKHSRCSSQVLFFFFQNLRNFRFEDGIVIVDAAML